MPKVSVIIPAYNAEKHISLCLDSVLSQDFPDMEVIVLDDGSRDSTPAIVDSYAEKDSRILAVHKPNSGVSATRNRGLELAAGEYIEFVDADDRLAPGAVKLLVRAMEEHDCDLVVADFYRVNGTHLARKGDILNRNVLSQEEYADYMMQNPADFYYGVLWNKLYRRSIIEENSLRMDIAFTWCEDFVFNLEYNLHARTYFALPVPVYYYNNNEGSLVNTAINALSVMRTKIAVFNYYDKFYKHILDPADYSLRRPEIYSFLLSYATDGSAIPYLPGTKKLGEEIVPAYVREGMDDDCITSSYYRNRLFDRLLQPAALANDLEIKDIRALYYIWRAHTLSDPRELADFLDETPFTAGNRLSRLSSRKLITNKAKKKKKEKKKKDSEGLLSRIASDPQPKEKNPPYRLTEKADPVIGIIRTALEDLNAIRMKDISASGQYNYRKAEKQETDNLRQTLTSIPLPPEKEKE